MPSSRPSKSKSQTFSERSKRSADLSKWETPQPFGAESADITTPEAESDTPIQSKSSSRGRNRFKYLLDTTATIPVIGPTDQSSVPIATATDGRDVISGEGWGGVTFAWGNLTDSLLKGKGTRRLIDRVIGFAADDMIDAPSNIGPLQILSPRANIKKMTPGQINAKGVGGESFLANTATAFTCTGFNGTFVVMNDSRNGYQQLSDGIIFLQDYIAEAVGPITII